MAAVVIPASVTELPAFVELWNMTWPSLALTVEELERDNATLPPEMQEQRWLASVDGVTVGFANVHRPASSFDLRRWWVDVGVRPDHRKSGIGRALYETAFAHVDAAGMDHLDTRLREGDADAIAFAERRGFKESRRDFESRLDLREMDESAMSALGARGEAAIRIATLTELDSPSFRRHFHDVFEVVRKDVPRPEPPVRLTFEFFQEQVLDEPAILPDGWFFALDGEEVVGFTGMYRGANEGWLDQWLTGVMPTHRGKGIAFALKARAALWGKAAGFTTIRTDNNSKNAAMLAVNDRCGFVRSLAILMMRKSA